MKHKEKSAFGSSAFDRFFSRIGLGMRAKLIILFLCVKLIPIILIVIIAWNQFSVMGRVLDDKMRGSLHSTRDEAVNDSIDALTAGAREDIERMTTYAAQTVAKFLYQRDDDIRFLASFDASADPDTAAKVYANFMRTKRGNMLVQGEWGLGTEQGTNRQVWEPINRPDAPDDYDPFNEYWKYFNSENEAIPNPDQSGTPTTRLIPDDEHNGFHYRPPDGFEYESRPLYDEIAFIDTKGNEKIRLVWQESDETDDKGRKLGKIAVWNNGAFDNSKGAGVLGSTKINNPFIAEGAERKMFDVDGVGNPVSYNQAATYVKAEEEFIKTLSTLDKDEKGKPEIFVSDVTGAYVKSDFAGMYTRGVLAGQTAHPNYNGTFANIIGPDKIDEFMNHAADQGFAGAENPTGQRFEGIVRWAMPVYNENDPDKKTGYVTFALNHDHIMELTDHLTPAPDKYNEANGRNDKTLTVENGRFTELSNADAGNYAFIWDYKCRSIVHPRHYSIVGFDPATGDPEVPWLQNSIYDDWQANGQGKLWLNYLLETPLLDANGNPVIVDGIHARKHPIFTNQSRANGPAAQLTAQGKIGLDGRWLNNAPQCTGWMNLTEKGGSGSFYILWSGLPKLTTAAAIPYYTGHYSPDYPDREGSRRGFGMFTVGAGLDDFQKPATATAAKLSELVNEQIGLTHGTIDNTRKSTTLQLFLITAFVLALVVAVALWLSSYMTRNITRLNAGVERFRSGQRQFRFNAPLKDEFGHLADSFDDMAESIEDSVRNPLSIIDMDKNIIYMNEPGLSFRNHILEEVVGKPYAEYSIYPAGTEYCPIRALEENHEASIYYAAAQDRYLQGTANYFFDKAGKKSGYIIVSSDLTDVVRERKQVEHQNVLLRKTQADLQEAVHSANVANEHKGEFLARMSHEIRTPMNAIMGITSIVERKLEESNCDNEAINDVKAHIRQIGNSSQHLLSLLNDILDLSKIDAGKIDMAEESIDLAELAETVSAMIRPRCAAKGIAFDAKIDDFSSCAYLSDSLRLRQVLINLLGNAVKFTPELGRIEFRIENKDRQDGKTLVKFTVQDNGIGMKPDVVANLFKPFEQGDRNISRKYGGTGLGLAISGRIVNLMGGAIDVQSEEGKGSAFSFEIWLAETEKILAGETAVQDAEGKFTGKRVLLVDDVEINRMIVESLLEPTGVSIVEAADGAEALKLFTESVPGYYDMILMDIQMPVMDGHQSSAAIRASGHPDAVKTPIIALTANAFKDDIDRAVASGMNAHIAKPVEYEKLAAILFKFLK